MEGGTQISSDTVDVSDVDTTPLDIEDLYDVREELTPVTTNWKSFGCALQLESNILESIQTKNSSDPGCLTSVVKEWLKRNYNEKKFGPPTWQRLVKALSDITGGANMALASDIAKKYKATVPQQTPPNTQGEEEKQMSPSPPSSTISDSPSPPSASQQPVVVDKVTSSAPHSPKQHHSGSPPPSSISDHPSSPPTSSQSERTTPPPHHSITDEQVVPLVSQQLQPSSQETKIVPEVSAPKETPSSPQEEEESKTTQSSSDVIDVREVDSSPLDIDDLFEVKKELFPVAALWKSIGIALRLNPNALDNIQAENIGYHPACIDSMLSEWLNRKYKVKKFGEPTWQQLVEAVGHPAGGANMAIARKIAKNHKPGGEEPSLEKQQAIQTTTTAREDEVKGEVGKLPQPETRETEETAAQKEERKDEEDPTPKSARTKVCTWVPDGVVDLAIGEKGIEAEEPMTVGQLFKDAVDRFPKNPALKYKEDGKWKDISYKEYYDLCIKAAKSFLKLGLEPYHAVAILGFNSPEWFISNLGAMFAGGLPTGIYTTSKTEACYSVASDCQANIIVVENQKQLDKILAIRDRLPHLKAIVQYKGELSQKYPNVYEWEEFLKLGDGITSGEVMKKIVSQKPGQCALLIYTSGTSGNPNGVMLSHDNLTFTSRALKETYKRLRDGEEQGVSYLPLSHISAQMTDIYLPLLVGATMYFAQPDALRGSLGKTLKEVKPTFFFGVPRVYDKIMERLQEKSSEIKGFEKIFSDWAKKKGTKGSQRKMASRSMPKGWVFANYFFKNVHEALGFQRCKIFVVGADTMRMDVHDFFMSINIQLMELYGMSESSGPHTLNLIQQDAIGWKVGSCGKTIMGVQLKIVDPDGNMEREEGKEGEVCIKGRHVFMGYLNKKEETMEAICSDGWLHSGDIGKVEDGFLDVLGRKKDMITTPGGEKIHPVPIENMIKSELPFLSNVVVVGDKREFLTCLMTLKCKMNDNTGEPSDTLTPLAQKEIQNLGSHSTKVSEIVTKEDEAVFAAIWNGLDRVNKDPTSKGQRVQNWTLLDSDFSIPGGELGHTYKIRRHAVHKKYAAIIEGMYSESYTLHRNDVQCNSDSPIPRADLGGVEVIGMKEFTVSAESLTFEWEGYGLKVHISEGSLPVDVGECRVNIKASLSGQFQLPEDSDLLSPVFWISAPYKFTKPVTLEIQHCALTENETGLSDLSFVSAKCSERDLPYRFKQLDGGVFTHSSYGSIQLSHFSGIGVTGRKNTPKSYCARLYSTMKEICDWRYYFVITQDLDAKNMVVREHYGHFAKEEASLRITFGHSEITLDIPKDGEVTKEGWRITPCSYPTISSSDAAHFQPGQWIPQCQLIVQWERKDGRPAKMIRKLNLIGAKAPSNFIHLTLNPVIEGVVRPPSTPIGSGSMEYCKEQQPNLPQLICFKIRSGSINILEQIGARYRELGVLLLNDTTGTVTQAIALQHHETTNNINFEILQRWIQGKGKLPIEWVTLVGVLKDIGLTELAGKIEQGLKLA